MPKGCSRRHVSQQEQMQLVKSRARHSWQPIGRPVRLIKTLYERLVKENRMLYEAWWLDDRYSYNRIPFQPKGMGPEELQRGCLAARRRFYSWPSILRRSFAPVNRSNGFMWRNFYLINGLHRNDVSLRDHYPLGDEAWRGEILQAN